MRSPFRCPRSAASSPSQRCRAVSARVRHSSGVRQPAASSAPVRARRASLASATTGRAPSLCASRATTLMPAKRTPGCWNREFDPVVRSISRVPTAITRSASRASAFAARVPVTPMPPSASSPPGRAPFPAEVSATGTPRRSDSSASSGRASAWWTPPPAISSGRSAVRTASTTALSSAGAGGRRTTGQVRGSNRLGGEVVGLRLHVLMERQRHRAGLGGVEQDAHRLRQRGQQLLRSRDAIEERAQWAEGVVDRQVGLARVLERLHDRAGPAPGERVGRQQQRGHPVDRGRGGPGSRSSTRARSTR